MRVAWRDGDDNVIQLANMNYGNEFNLTVVGTGEASSCEGALAELMTSVAYDQDLLFDATEYVKDVYLKNTLSVNVYGTNAECKPLYKLLVKNPESGKWVSWSQMKEWLQGKVPNSHLTSKIVFNATNSEFSATFSKDDIEAVRSHLEAAGKSTLQFKIVAIIPGSTDMGATTPNDALVSAQFSIILIDSSVAETCASNILLPATNTKSGEVRPDFLEYKIPTMDQ
jgi:hypothetical protein